MPPMYINASRSLAEVQTKKKEKRTPGSMLRLIAADPHVVLFHFFLWHFELSYLIL